MVVPLGLADLETSGPLTVGARLLELSADSVLLGDALRTITAWIPEDRERRPGEGESLTWGRLSAPAPSPPEVPRPGDWVLATLVRDAAGLWCAKLERATPGRIAPQRVERERGLLARAQVLKAVRAYFEEQDFVEVSTPTMGTCPGLDPHVHSLAEIRVGQRQEFLMTSPEFFMKRLLARGWPRLFQVTSAFRAEELGPLHEPEFTLTEWYRSFADEQAALDDIEELVCRAARALRPFEEPVLFGPPEAPGPILLERPFVRMTVAEAFARWADVSDVVALAETRPDDYFQLLVDRVEPGLARLRQPVLLTNYPASQAALARLSESVPGTADRFELSVAGIELCNGYVELTNPFEQRQRFNQELERRAAAGEPLYPLDERFLDALQDGMPPACGVALGVERLVLLAAGLAQLESALAFGWNEH